MFYPLYLVACFHTGENKIKVESIQQTDSFKEDKFDEDTKKNENFETRKQYRDDVTRKFSNEKEIKDEGETNSATDCSGSELSSSGSENVPIGQHKRKQYKDGHQKSMKLFATIKSFLIHDHHRYSTALSLVSFYIFKLLILYSILTKMTATMLE